MNILTSSILHMRKYRKLLFPAVYFEHLVIAIVHPALYSSSFRFLNISTPTHSLFPFRRSHYSRGKSFICLFSGAVRVHREPHRSPPAIFWKVRYIHTRAHASFCYSCKCGVPEVPCAPCLFSLPRSAFGCPIGPQSSERRERLPRAIRKGEDETENRGTG